MPVLKYQRYRQQLRNTGMSKTASRLVLLIFVFLNLVLVMSLSGCASNCSILKEEPKVTPIESVIDVSDWQQKVKNYSTELKAQLNSANGIIDNFFSKNADEDLGAAAASENK